MQAEELSDSGSEASTATLSDTSEDVPSSSTSESDSDLDGSESDEDAAGHRLDAISQWMDQSAVELAPSVREWSANGARYIRAEFFTEGALGLDLRFDTRGPVICTVMTHGKPYP